MIRWYDKTSLQQLDLVSHNQSVLLFESLSQHFLICKLNYFRWWQHDWLIWLLWMTLKVTYSQYFIFHWVDLIHQDMLKSIWSSVQLHAACSMSCAVLYQVHKRARAMFLLAMGQGCLQLGSSKVNFACCTFELRNARQDIHIHGSCHCIKCA